MPAPSNLAHAPLPTSLLAPQAALTIATRTCLLEGPAFDADDNLFFSDIIGNQVYRMTPDGELLDLPGRQRPDQRQHVRRSRASDQLRGRRVWDWRQAPACSHRSGNRADRGFDRTISKVNVTTVPMMSWWTPRDASGSPIHSTGRIARAGAGCRSRLPHRRQRYGRARAVSASNRASQWAGDHAGCPDALCDRQPHAPWRES